MAEKILVTTEYIRKKKDEWKGLLKQARTAFLEAADSAEILEEYFCGKPVRTLKQEMKAEVQEGAVAFNILMSHIEKLEDMALVYEEAERSNIYVRAGD